MQVPSGTAPANPASTVRLASHRDHGNDLLKWFALVSMTVDHVNRTLVAPGGDLDPVMFAIGRLAYPLFAWLVAVRIWEKPTRWRKYLVRLVPAAVVTQPVYALALTDTQFGDGGMPFVIRAFTADLNIFATLAAGVGVCAALQTVKDVGSGGLDLGGTIVIGVIAVILAPATNPGIAGVLLVPGCLVALWIGPVMAPVLCGVYLVGLNGIGGPAFALLSLPAGILVPMLIWFLRTRTVPGYFSAPGWLFYGYYPAHLAMLWLASVS